MTKPLTIDIGLITDVAYGNVSFYTTTEKLLEAKLAKKTRKIYTIM